MQSITEFLTSILSSETGSLSFLQFFFAIGISYLGGVVSSLTPCIYPMIPITISVMGGLGNERTIAWASFWTRGLIYVLGMALIYAFLGVVAALTGKIFGTFTQTSVGYLIIGSIITIAALFMLEVIQFDPFISLQQWIRKLRGLPPESRYTEIKEKNFLTTFSLGASSGFIAAPCTTPVLTAILAYISTSQSVILGFVLMLAFSLGLGTLLLVITLFTSALKFLPKSGQWMKMIKISSGVLLLAFAEYLIFKAGQLGGH